MGTVNFFIFWGCVFLLQLLHVQCTKAFEVGYVTHYNGHSFVPFSNSNSCGCNCCINNECREMEECTKVLKIVGIVIGSLIGVCCISIVLCYCVRKRRGAQQTTQVYTGPVTAQPLKPYGQPVYNNGYNNGAGANWNAQPQFIAAPNNMAPNSYAQPQYAQPQYAQPQYAQPQYAAATPEDLPPPEYNQVASPSYDTPQYPTK